MADADRAPLLAPENEERRESEEPPVNAESAPLLADADTDAELEDTNEIDTHDAQAPQPTWASWPRWKRSSTSAKRDRRWPSVIAGIILAALVVAVLIAGFVLPGAVQEYAENAAVIEPTSLSVESITSDGVRARIQANVRLDGSRVENVNSRRLGRFATGLMRKLETGETEVNVYLPHYEKSLLGSATVPPITIDLVDGHNTALDFVTDLRPGEADNLRKIANDWLEGKLDRLEVLGTATLKLKSGIFPLGTHDVDGSMVFEGQSLYRSFAALYFGEKMILQ